MKARGFTLIELMVVVLIISILSAVAIPQYQKFSIRAKSTEVQLMVRELSNAQTISIMMNGRGFTIMGGGTATTKTKWSDADIEYLIRWGGTLPARETYCFYNSNVVGNYDIYFVSVSCDLDGDGVLATTCYNHNMNLTSGADLTQSGDCATPAFECLKEGSQVQNQICKNTAEGIW